MTRDELKHLKPGTSVHVRYHGYTGPARFLGRYETPDGPALVDVGERLIVVAPECVTPLTPPPPEGKPCRTAKPKS